LNLKEDVVVKPPWALKGAESVNRQVRKKSISWKKQ